jgi:DMSO/TMAO reductase YedYZ molybdopterin-dependent catalytic subunit
VDAERVRGYAVPGIRIITRGDTILEGTAMTMAMRPRAFGLLAALAMLGADGPKAERVVLEVGGEVERPIKLTAGDLAGMIRQSVRAKDHKGVESSWEGVAVIDLLRKAGARVDDKLRGGAMVDYLVVEASDGYRAAFALAEIDPAFTDRVTLLADRRDGHPMAEPEGPLRVVVPGEKKHARWVRQVNRLTVRRAPTVPAAR